MADLAGDYHFVVMPEPDPPLRTNRQTLHLALFAGLALLLLFTSQVYIWINWWPLKVSWLTALYWSFPQLAVWIAGMRLVVAMTRRWPVEQPHRNSRVLLHSVSSVLLAFIGLALLDLSDRWLGWSVGMGAPSSLISSMKYTIIHLHMGIGVYWVTLAITQAVSYRGDIRQQQVRLGELAGELAQTRLAALRMQLQPHFLFNTLNGIAVAIRTDPANAESMVHRLADFLRLTLDTSEVAEITLEEELDAVGAYLAIEQTRFGDGLEVCIRTTPDSRTCLVPTLVLQPLVENAIRHAISQRAAGGRIDIEARRMNDRLVITVTDDGPGISDHPGQGGVGLRNTRRRLETHYGTEARFTLGARAEGGTQARLELPVRQGGFSESLPA
jgi:sensor histidine kinase YesM